MSLVDLHPVHFATQHIVPFYAALL